jgi:D-3-phosphoglycerate dehydrogenase
MRQIPQQMESLKAGEWQMGVGKSLRGRTLGLYGYGRIGQAVAEVGKAFGMKVQWWGSDEGRARAKAAGEVVPQSREAFFASSDVISLHLRLVPETRGIITSRDFKAMRSDAVLVNTSRAGLIEPRALLNALNTNAIEMAAVDVFDTEPLTDASDELLSHPRLIGTPHIGFVTQDEFNKQFGDAFDQINAFATSEPINMINPEVWKS